MGLRFQKECLDKLEIGKKIDYYTMEICKQTKFLRRIYREYDTSLWPTTYKTVDCARGYPQNFESHKTKATKKSKPTSLINDMNDGDQTDPDHTDIDSEDSEDENYGNHSKNILLQYAAERETKSNKNNPKSSDKQEMDEDSENDDDPTKILNGKNYVNINVEEIDFSMPDGVVATKSMTLWLHFCDSWIEAMMSDSSNLWLLEELYRDPLLAVYILNCFPVAQYLAINMKKLFGVSNSNMPAERALKYPKHAVGIYSHRLLLDTVAEYANINESILKDELNFRTENEFNEVHFLTKNLIEIIGLESKYSYCSALITVYETAKETVQQMHHQHQYWSYVFFIFFN